jgi:hypothetical protein
MMDKDGVYIPTYKEYVEASYLDDWQRRYKLVAERNRLRLQNDRLQSELRVLRSILESTGLGGLT